MIEDLSGSWYIKRTDESMTRVDSPLPLMQHVPDRSWIPDSDPDHPKGTHPKSFGINLAHIKKTGMLVVISKCFQLQKVHSGAYAVRFTIIETKI